MLAWSRPGSANQLHQNSAVDTMARASKHVHQNGAPGKKIGADGKSKQLAQNGPVEKKLSRNGKSYPASQPKGKTDRCRKIRHRSNFQILKY
jgi:hypothetical protein